MGIQLADPSSGLIITGAGLAVKPQAPIFVDSNGVGLKLATTTPGLYLVSGGLAVLLKTAGHLSVDVNGLYYSGSLSIQSDVVITSPANNDVLLFDGLHWVNSPSVNSTLASLTDVVLTTPLSGQVLTYNGSKWINAASAGGVSSVGGTAPIASSGGTTPSISLTLSSNSGLQIAGGLGVQAKSGVQVSGGFVTANVASPLGTTSTQIALNYGNGLTLVAGELRPGASGVAGLSVTITTAKLTAGGANGSMTFTSGVLTAQTAAT
jgi:hypothetical protein